MAAGQVIDREDQRSRFWPTAKALRALGYQLPDDIADDQVVDLIEQRVSSVTHAEWQLQVIDAARLFGWQHLHVRRTVGRGRQWTTATNVVGWPDLWLWHPRRGFAAIELKVRPDKAKPEQLEVLASLEAAGARTLVAYPDDWPAVEALLRGAVA